VSSVVAGKPVNIGWYHQQQQPPISSSSVTATQASLSSTRPVTADSKDVLVELNTDVVNNDNEDDAIVVDPVQQTSQVG